MSQYQCVKTLTMIAGENLTGDQYELLTVNSSGQVVKQSTEHGRVDAILAENPGTTAAGDAVAVVDPHGGGIGLVKAGESISAGDYVHVDGTDGKAQGSSSVTAGRYYVGIALEAASAADEIIQVKLGPISH